MHRRRFVTGLSAGAFSGLLLSGRATRARDATPTSGSVLPPLRWELRQIAGGRTDSAPDRPEEYWVQFLPDGTVAIRADCNRASGSYALDGSSLTLSQLASTKAACPAGSLSDRFLAGLGYVVSFSLAGDTEDMLVLSLMADGGQLNFAPSLRGVVWQWVRLERDGGQTERVGDPSRFTLAFDDEGGIQLLADCNRGFGTAKIDGHELALTAATTRKYCGDGSQDAAFLNAISRTETYAIKDGSLRLRSGDAVAVFTPALS